MPKPWKWYPFRTELPRVGHCREYLPRVTQFKRLSAFAIRLSKWKKFQLFNNNCTGGKKLLEESVNSIGKFLKVIGNFAYWILMNYIFNGFFKLVKGALSWAYCCFLFFFICNLFFFFLITFIQSTINNQKYLQTLRYLHYLQYNI